MTTSGLAKGVTMEQHQALGPSLHDVERVYLERLRLAAQVILDAAAELELVTDPLDGELVIFKERVEYLLLLPERTDEVPERAKETAREGRAHDGEP